MLLLIAPFGVITVIVLGTASTERLLKLNLNKQVAAKLSVSEVTVKVHRSQVMQKMRADSFAELVRMCETLRTTPARSL